MPYNESIMGKSIPDQEIEVMNFWREEKVFEKSVNQRPVDNQFVLYDGPPFATGLPHYGHVLAHTIKDVLPRYHTMQGKRVERRFGWDCHGVPVEFEVEKALALKGKADIEEMGIAQFNEACRSIVLKYTNEWRAIEERLGRFVDMENDYKTMDPDFMESVWSVFKKIDDKELVYEGKKIVAYSTGLGTALSDFESKLNYKKVQDPEIVMSFPLADEPDVSLLVWTTTPWSVPGNVAIALNKKIEYVQVTTIEDKKYILGKTAVNKHFKPDQIKEWKDIDFKNLVGKRYQPLFKPSAETTQENCFTIIESDHVTDADGTGMVHIACAFGEDDYKLGQQFGLPALDYFDNNGFFKEELADFSEAEEKSDKKFTVKGQTFKDADKILIDYMKQQGKIFHHGTVHHEYPFCWRTDKPLMYRAVSSWYVKVTAIKNDIIANNNQINWYPDEVGHKRFHNWLSNAHDWAISRSRYWGTPIPVWRNDTNPNDYIVIGSIAELEALSGVKATDLHRHFIDDIVIQKNGNSYHRIPEVFDCWFESGAMPYAQAHYPFENKQLFENTFPADFIAEGLDQTRGWFYTLMVLSTAMFNMPAFKNCVVNGILLGSDGKKMSKSKRNYPDMKDVFSTYGADALRFLLMGSGATQAKEMKVVEKDIDDITRLVFIPILNVFKLFAMQANKVGFEPSQSFSGDVIFTTPLDQWLFFATERLKENMKNHFETYNLIAACNEVRQFVDLFSNLYVRNSKNRFRNSTPEDINQGLMCMHHALDSLSKCMAPLTPFVGEIIYQALYGKNNSVHLQLWPTPLPVNEYTDTFESIEIVRKVIRLSNAIRQKQGVELSQPLSNINLSSGLRNQLLQHEDMLKSAVNVENITWLDSTVDNQLQRKINLDRKILGPLFNKNFKQLESDFNQDNYTFENNVLTINNLIIPNEGYTISYEPVGNLCGAMDSGIWVTMDCGLTPELQEKGQLRKLLHAIQMLRKSQKFTPQDTIEVTISGNPALFNLVDKYLTTISTHTLSEVKFISEHSQDASEAFKVGDLDGHIQIAKLANRTTNTFDFSSSSASVTSSPATLFSVTRTPSNANVAATTNLEAKHYSLTNK